MLPISYHHGNAKSDKTIDSDEKTDEPITLDFPVAVSKDKFDSRVGINKLAFKQKEIANKLYKKFSLNREFIRNNSVNQNKLKSI